MITSAISGIFERDLNKLSEEISLYESEGAIWTVPPGVLNSGGNLCMHICGNLQHFIGTVLGNTGYVRNRDREFSVKNLSRKELLEEIKETIIAVTSTLKVIPDSDLDEEYTALPPHFEGKEKLSKFYFLAHLIAHLNYHLGQINYHRRMVKNI